MNKFDYLIIGGGIAGTSAAEEIRSRDKDGSIIIVTEEPHHLYSRVLLPHFLRDENTIESVFVRKLDTYQEKNILLKTSTRVSQINTREKTVATLDGEQLSYGKLLIATGGKVNKLTTKGSDLPEVVYMRTLEDVEKIKGLIGNSKDAVVLGGGFIGAEFAQSFVKNNLKTTAIIREKYFWENVVGENSGKLLSLILEKNGVRIVNEAEIVEVTGKGKLEGIKLGDGQELKTDIAGVGIGIHLDLEYLKDSELVIKKGIVTNEFLETSAKDVWAAGDVAEFFDPVSKRHHTLGNWANASSQGRAVGINMVVERIAFETVSMYSINIFESNFAFLGSTLIDENTEIIERGDVNSNKLSRIILQDDTVVGVSMINTPLERPVFTRLIKNKTKISVSKSKLSDLNFDLNSIIN